MQGAHARFGDTSGGVQHRVLVVTRDHALAGALEEALAVWGFEAEHAESEAAALRACADRLPSAVLVEQLHDASMSSVSRSIRAALGVDTPPLVIVGHGISDATRVAETTRVSEAATVSDPNEGADATAVTDAISLQVPFRLDDLRLALEHACGDVRRLMH